MKEVTAAFKAHIRGGVTTVCTCISVKRRDSVMFGFTDHDEPLTVNGTLYLPLNSFSRTSIANTASLEVDSMEIEGILNSTAVARADVSGGLFDFSEVKVLIVNYEQPDAGFLNMREGWIGEVEMTEDNTFHAELRGLSQVFSYRLGAPFEPECDADLGDKRCKIGLDPGFWQPETPYREGSFVIGHITAAVDSVNAVILNADLADQTNGQIARNPDGWVTYAGVDGRWSFRSGWHGLASPPTGSLFAAITDATGTSDTHELGMYQDVDLVASGLDTGDIDTGVCQAVMTGWVACMTSHGEVRMRMSALDASGNVRNIFDSGTHNYALDRWIALTANNVLIPTGTRKVRVDFYCTKKVSDNYGAAFGGVQLSFNDPSGTFHSDLQADGVMFQAQTPGVTGSTEPAFAVTLDATYVDNDVTWKCVKSFKDVTTVTTVVSNQNFTCTLPQPSGYYDGGLLIWETGINAGHAMEVKTWDGTHINLFQRTFNVPSVGDRFVIHPGCDKRRETCISRFNNILNFRGFPDVPGQDAYMQRPDTPSS